MSSEVLRLAHDDGRHRYNQTYVALFLCRDQRPLTVLAVQVDIDDGPFSQRRLELEFSSQAFNHTTGQEHSQTHPLAWRFRRKKRFADSG